LPIGAAAVVKPCKPELCGMGFSADRSEGQIETQIAASGATSCDYTF